MVEEATGQVTHWIAILDNHKFRMCHLRHVEGAQCCLQVALSGGIQWHSQYLIHYGTH